MKRQTNKITVIAFAAFFALISILCWALPQQDFSESERRALAKYKAPAWNTIANGEFMKSFESYSADQFPFRDGMRGIKAMFNSYAMGRLDNNGIYIADGYAVKMEYPLNEASIEYAAGRFEYIYEKYLKGQNNRIFYSVIPDKGYYLAKKNNYLYLDFGKMVQKLGQGMDNFAEYIDLSGSLDESCYYKTDTHWKQEKLGSAARALLTGMGNPGPLRQHKSISLDAPFYGVYYGQAALPLDADKLSYQIWDGMEECTARNGENGLQMDMYDLEKAAGRDPYEIFLGGSLSLVTIENPDAATDKDLIIFRDSFGSSIAPLLCESYKKITLVDIRYLMPDYLGKFVQFENADILFLYSTLVLNNSEAIK